VTFESPIYFDFAAATPVSEVALTAMQPYWSEYFYNPSSPYAPAVSVRRAYEAAKHELAVAIGAKADDIIMTAGATESINLALTAATDAHLVTTAIEHHAVLHAADQYDHTIVAVGRSGIVSPAAIEAAIRPDTTLISVALANNELGTIQPLRDIAALVANVRASRRDNGDTTPLWLHSDASQGIGQIDVNVARLGVDMITINAAKCYGPKQVALLWRSPRVTLKPIVQGGGQESGLRSGTENVAGTVGFAAALREATAKRKQESQRLSELRDTLESYLREHCPQLVVTIAGKKRLPGSLHVMVPGIDAERLVFMLEAKGVLVATGSACAANSGTRSHVLEAIGLAPEEADGSLRLTLGRTTTEQDVLVGGEAIVEVINTELQRIAR
jgi:cysteine desulfurase